MTERNPLQRLAKRLAKHLPFIQPKPVETLSTLFHRDTGKPAAKWQGYLQHYDRHLAVRKDQPVRILEIGVQAGGSLEVWAEYFKSASLIIGCDIDTACSALRYDDSRIKVLIGDINTPETLQSLSALTDTLDVVIDDGSHHSNDIILSFVNLFPCIADGGVYLIEDLHCSYWENYGGGLYNPFSAISFFKKIVDIINRPIWGVDEENIKFFSEFQFLFNETAITEKWKFLSDIHSIEFVNSICVIHKRSAKNNTLGMLVLSGCPEAIEKSPFNYSAAEMSVPDQSKNMFSLVNHKKQSDDLLLKAYEEITKLQQEKIKLTTQFYEATKKYYDATVIIQQLEQHLNLLKKNKNP